MKVWFWKEDRVVTRETDAIDIWTKKYTIRIRISGVTIIRHAKPKKGIPEEVKYDHQHDLT